PPRVVSFGHVFARGELRPGLTPVVRLGAREAAAQFDAKALYPDGSVRHGVLSVEIPGLAPGGALAGEILPASARPPAPPPPERAEVPPLVATLTFRSGPDAGRETSFDLRTLASRPTKTAPWLN